MTLWVMPDKAPRQHQCPHTKPKPACQNVGIHRKVRNSNCSPHKHFYTYMLCVFRPLVLPNSYRVASRSFSPSLCFNRSPFSPRPHIFRSQGYTMADNPSKKLKLDGPLIGTHSGHFHADEALAVFLLRLLPTYNSSPLVRTRDPAVLATCHTVVDVGGEYSTETNRYDHHQRGFDAIFPEHNTKLSSAGLVYLHFGKAIISQTTGLAPDSEDVSVLYEKIYSDFIEAFDANDNGISAYDTAALKSANITKRFDDKSFSLAAVINRYNYATKPPTDPAPTKEMLQAVEDANFARASAFTGEQFLLQLTGAHESWLPARAEVRQVYHSRNDVHASKQILVLPKPSTPYASHLYALEDENPSEPKILYVLFPESADADSKWRIRAVSVENGAFENRKDLPDAWKGLRDEELSTVSGVPGCVFVHAAGFIGGNLTREGALAMAVKAIET